MSEEVLPLSRYQFQTNRYDVHVGDKEGNTPLHIAIKEEKLDIVKTVLDYGSKVNSVNKLRETPLHLAAKQQKLNIMHTLLKEGANPNDQDSNKCTPLHNFLHVCTEAQWMKKEDRSKIIAMVREMLEHGAQSNIKNAQGKTAIHLAIHAKQRDLVEILMEDAKQKDASMVNNMQWLILGTGVISLVSALAYIKIKTKT